MTNLIKELNNMLKPKDPVQQVIENMNNEFIERSQHYLDDEQVEVLADYMHEMIKDAGVRDHLINNKEAALMALDDVAGFETAPKRVIDATVARLMQAYIAKYGQA
jgi:hypothetical protein